MPVTLSIKRNSRELQKLKARLMSLSRHKGDVGFFEESVYPSDDGDRGGLPVASIAYSNNYGIKVTQGPNIPERAFFTMVAHDEKTKFSEQITTIVRDSMAGNRSWKSSFKIYLERFKNAIKAEIVGFSSPPNAEKTIALKGKDDPLIRDSIMLNSVNVRIRGIK